MHRPLSASTIQMRGNLIVCCGCRVYSKRLRTMLLAGGMVFMGALSLYLRWMDMFTVVTSVTHRASHQNNITSEFLYDQSKQAKQAQRVEVRAKGGHLVSPSMWVHRDYKNVLRLNDSQAVFARAKEIRKQRTAPHESEYPRLHMCNSKAEATYTSLTPNLLITYVTHSLPS